MFPATRALDTAATGRLVVTRLTSEQRAHLQELQHGIAARQARLPLIETESVALRGALNAALTKIQADPKLSARGRRTAQTTVGRLTTRLDAIPPTTATFKQLLAREEQVLSKGMRIRPER